MDGMRLFVYDFELLKTSIGTTSVVVILGLRGSLRRSYEAHVGWKSTRYCLNN